MSKVLGVVVVLFGVAGCALGALTGALGSVAEPIALGAVGMGLYGSSLIFGSKWSSAPTQTPVKTS
jgi:hypothetical protein